MNIVYKKIVRVIKSKKISDHWKEKILPIYSLLIFRASLSMFFALIIVFSPFIVAIYLTPLFDLNIQTNLSFPAGLIGTTFVAIMYGFVRGHYAKK